MLNFYTELLFSIFTFFIVKLSFAQLHQKQFNEDIVKVSGGFIRGVTNPETDIRHFWGIPYAQSPVGDLRWRAPQPVKTWNGIRDANKFGPKAMQKFIFTDMRFRTDSMSEDCLYLNVWTPANSSTANLPVLVYFFGGGFIAGDGSEWRYDGESLAQKGIVVVTVNYRLGIFGFFSYPALTKESPHHSSGNYGLLDQQAALEWVHQNIAAFSGNPDHITIGGESAGSISVFAQMASPLSRHLIAGAIGESGAMINPTLPAISLDSAERMGEAFAKKVGANSLKALRAIPAEKLLDESFATKMVQWPAIVDGYFLPQSPLKIFEEGKQAYIPLLVGWNSTESPYQGLMRGKMPTPENYEAIVRSLYRKNTEEALKLFPGNNEEEVIRSATRLASDRFIVYSTWKWAELQRLTGEQPVYRYNFGKARPPMVDAKEEKNSSMPPPLKGAEHSWEIEYALGNLSTNKTYAWTPDDYKVSAIMEDYFANFIKTGNPNGIALPKWTGNMKGEPVMVMHINVQSELEPEQHLEQFQFLDKLYGAGE
ncbi:MAG: carboxylesterase family protein [Chitinophagaceae bacterium]|nr:MAG: carboxylesterase family protein [Chitinophagaceae bacterium]